MTEPTKCTDCNETVQLAGCTICGKVVCPAHRAGTGRLVDGYQCMERGCWAVRGRQAFEALRDRLGWNSQT